jgi:hypothetical protein
MSTKATFTVVVGLVLLCGDMLFAQSKPRPSIISQALRNGNLKLNVSNGRISTKGSRPGSYSSRTSSSSGRREVFSLRSSNGHPRLSYERSSSKEKLTLVISEGSKFHFKRVVTPAGKKDTPPPVELEFIQSPGQPLLLTLAGKTYRAESLWLLLLEHPEAFKEHVLPLLEMLRPGWNLPEVAEQVEVKLLDMAAGAKLPNNTQWEELLVQLSSDSFARRQAADRQLREGGETVLRFLRQLDFKSLDAEQQFRVQRMIIFLSKKAVDDSLDEITARLIGDSRAWLILLSREQQSTREVAAKRLSAILGKSIDFDPTADQKTRQRQVERLKKQLKSDR